MRELHRRYDREYENVNSHRWIKFNPVDVSYRSRSRSLAARVEWSRALKKTTVVGATPLVSGRRQLSGRYRTRDEWVCKFKDPRVAFEDTSFGKVRENGGKFARDRRSDTYFGFLDDKRTLLGFRSLTRGSHVRVYENVAERNVGRFEREGDAPPRMAHAPCA